MLRKKAIMVDDLLDWIKGQVEEIKVIKMSISMDEFNGRILILERLTRELSEGEHDDERD